MVRNRRLRETRFLQKKNWPSRNHQNNSAWLLTWGPSTIFWFLSQKPWKPHSRVYRLSRYSECCSKILMRPETVRSRLFFSQTLNHNNKLLIVDNCHCATKVRYLVLQSCSLDVLQSNLLTQDITTSVDLGSKRSISNERMTPKSKQRLVKPYGVHNGAPSTFQCLCNRAKESEWMALVPVLLENTPIKSTEAETPWLV